MIWGSVIEKIKIIIADFSGFTRLVLTDILNAEVDLEVLDTAENGDDLLRKIKAEKPDLVIADYDLPKNSRLYCFRRIQQDYQIPILLLVSRDTVAEDFIFQTMKVGVYDYVKIPAHTILPQFRKIQEEILLKARAVMEIKKFQQSLAEPANKSGIGHNSEVAARRSNRYQQPRSFVVIGASTGGTKAIEYILGGIKPELKTVILVALHLPGRFTGIFSERLKRLTALKVMEGKIGTRLEAGKVIVAPGNKNMVITRHLGLRNDFRISFSEEPANEFDCPSVDILMNSVAALAGPCTLGVILTGMGKDGTIGTQTILNNGGDTVAQDEESSVIFGMAKSAIENRSIKKILNLTQIPDYINRFAEYHQI
ncbi:chemotaxis response regulator protein-glutamate methylesterase [Adhaeribacter aerolatus]|uniref:protein-glutamate methylesterase n=1 Tax=Adhaeribacter aerolatus TaxID=670289 RepID=A0A512B1H9_9BACT|nr:chemotaxis protein CheB [Adhaeribacter aerolatus]GEO05802.1 chemotaxis response regulator protein-glutamate methylesterase [Adhaeribacter aerolatus]